MLLLSLLAVLGLIDIIAGIMLFTLSGFARYIGLILLWKGLVTLFFYLKRKLKK